MRLLKRPIDADSELRDVKAGRVALACDHCRRRKVRCDAGKPSCRNCLKLGDECSYSPTPRQTSAVSQFAALNQRIQHLEELLEVLVSSGAKLSGTDDSDDRDSSGESKNPTPPTQSVSPLGREGENSYRVPSFNDRLEALKKHIHVGSGKCLFYKVGTCILLLDRSDIDSISARLQDPDMYQRIMRLTQNVWRNNQIVMSRFLGVDPGLTSLPPTSLLPDPDVGDLNPDFLAYVVDFYGVTNGRVPNVFLTMAEFRDEELWAAEPGFVRRAAASLIVITMCVALRSRRSENAPFPPAVIDAERRKAIQNMLSVLAMLQHCKPSFLLVRICTLGAYLLTVFTTMPSLHTYLSSLCAMATTLGLGKYHVNSTYPLAEAQRRELVWCMLVSYQHTMATILSEKAWLSGRSSEIGKSHLDTSTLIEFYYRNNDLGLIYDKVRTRLFNINRRNVSGRDLYSEIVHLDRELDNWVQGRVPSSFVNDPALGNVDPEDVNSWLRELARSAMRHRYYLIRIAIHSVSAFYPEYLPQPVSGSVEKVSESAHHLLSLMRDGRPFRGAITAVFSMTVTTAVSALFYKHLKYPAHESNAQELLLLRQVLPMFKRNQWPEDEIGHPPSQVWDAMFDIMERQFQATQSQQVPPQSMNYTAAVPPTVGPGSAPGTGPTSVQTGIPGGVANPPGTTVPPKRKPRPRKRKKTEPSPPQQQPQAQQLSPADDPAPVAPAGVMSQSMPQTSGGPLDIPAHLAPPLLQPPSPASSQLLDSTFSQQTAQSLQFLRQNKVTKQDLDSNILDDDNLLVDGLFAKDDNCTIM